MKFGNLVKFIVRVAPTIIAAAPVVKDTLDVVRNRSRDRENGR